MFAGVIATAAALHSLSKPGRPILNRTGHLSSKHLTESTSAPRNGEIRMAEKSSLSTASCKATCLGANKSVIQSLAKQFRMISYDFRGHGGSDKIMDPNLYETERRTLRSSMR